MGKIVCTGCGDYVDVKHSRVCGSCNKAVCGTCAADNHNLCGECYGDMNYIN